MKKTTQIHIGGRHFYIDEDAFQKLNHYLEALKNHFADDGDTGKEIVDDIEQRVAELLEARNSNGNQAITIDDVNEIIRTLGDVEDFNYDEGDDSGQFEDSRKYHRRLFRDPDNYYVGGVCSGLAEYFNIDPLWVRLAFVVLLFAKGLGLLIYVIMWIVVPKARSTAEKLQMRGRPVNLATIKDSVNEEYERAMAGYPNSRPGNGVDQLMRTIGMVIMAFIKFTLAVIGVILIITGSVFLAALLMMVLGFTNILGNIQFWGFDLPQMSSFFSQTGHYYAALIALIFLILIPVFALIYGGIKILFNVRSNHPVLNAFLLTSWILALILFITLLIVNIQNSPVETSNTYSSPLPVKEYPRLRVEVIDNTDRSDLTHYKIFNYRFTYNRWNNALYNNPTLILSASSDEKFHLKMDRRIKNTICDDPDDFLDEIVYSWDLTDSVLYLNEYFHVEDEYFWMFAELDINLEIPGGRQIALSGKSCDMLDAKQQELYCRSATKTNHWTMSTEGVLVEAK